MDTNVNEILDQAKRSQDGSVRRKAQAYDAWSAASVALNAAQAMLATTLDSDEQSTKLSALRAELEAETVGQQANIELALRYIKSARATIREQEAKITAAQQRIADAAQKIVDAEAAHAAYLDGLRAAVQKAKEEEVASRAAL